MELTLDMNKVFEAFRRSYEKASNVYEAQEIVEDYAKFLELCAHYKKEV